MELNTMELYVVIENGQVYPKLYRGYAEAVKAAKTKHKEYLQEQIKQLQNLEDIETVLADINVLENANGLTRLYIEKGINIEIHRLPID